MVRDGKGHVRKEEGQMRTMEGRKTRQPEAFAREALGEDWRNRIEGCKSEDEWVRKTKQEVDQFLVSHNLPRDPKYVHWLKKKQEQKKIKRTRKEMGQLAAKLVKEQIRKGWVEGGQGKEGRKQQVKVKQGKKNWKEKEERPTNKKEGRGSKGRNGKGKKGETTKKRKGERRK